MKLTFLNRKLISKISIFILLNLCTIGLTFGQTYIKDIARDSARSDIRTGGIIEKAQFTTGESDIKLTVNVPAFQMTFWQNGKEVKNYPIGVGMKDYPIFVGMRDIDLIIWNPVWIPPDSDWVAPAMRGIVIKPTDPRNPLGKIKIPLGYGYLIHQATGTKDLGNLVSHGCIRVLRNDLYDLNSKVVAAHSLEITDQEISRAKRTKETFLVELEQKFPIEITYDTIVVEGGNLRIYPDVYGYKKNTVENLRKELKTNGVDDSGVSDSTLTKMLTRAKNKRQYVISLDQIKAGNYLNGKIIPVLTQAVQKKTKPKRRGR